MALADSLNTAAANWAAALVADSVSPQPSYLLDGKSVNRDEWREGLMKLIESANSMANALSPWVVITKQVL